MDIPHCLSTQLPRAGEAGQGPMWTRCDSKHVEEQKGEGVGWPTEHKAGCIQTALIKGCWNPTAGLG